jgi:hypothetical protein
MRCLTFSRSWFLVLVCLATGCRMTAPMTVWEPPLNRARTFGSIAMSPIAGPAEVTGKLHEAMIVNQPQAGQPIAFLHPQLLQEMTSIQLASFDGQPSDIAGLSAARRANADVLLQGQVLRVNTEPPPPRKSPLDKSPQPSEQISLSWAVIDVGSGERIGFHTLTIDREQAEKAYPDLNSLGGEPVDRVIQAISRESWAMFSPRTKTVDTMLVLPWFIPGSNLVRQGNGFARQGRWDLAEERWQDAAAKHSWNDAAWHNLALSAAAREDFELARRRLNHAKTWWPNDRADKTERWLDETQRSYHRALSLPDRQGGWLQPDPPPNLSPETVPSADPRDIDQLPWWTAIPGTKPPEWSWRQWLTQPWFM